MTVRHGPDISLVAGVAPFDRYPAPAQRLLAVNTDRLRLRAGTVLARRGRPVRELVVLLAGEAVTSEAAGDGAGRLAGRFGPGARFGADELVAGGRHQRTLVAATDVEVLVVAGTAYRWAVREQQPPLAVAG